MENMDGIADSEKIDHAKRHAYQVFPWNCEFSCHPKGVGENDILNHYCGTHRGSKINLG